MSLEDKQRFLREQIILASYDPDQFITYLKSDLIIQELQLENLQFQILQAIVLKFKQYKYYQNQPQSQPNIPRPQKRTKIQYDKLNNLFDYQFEQSIKCIQADPFSRNLQVFIPNIEITQTQGVLMFFGSKIEVWYNIKTNLNNNTTKRLQSDFEWLASTVNKLYPLTAIPDLVELPKNNNEENEVKRKKIEQYIQILAGKKELKKSMLFFQFLTAPYQKIQKIKKNYDSVNFVKGTHSVKNQQGLVKLTYTNKIRNYFQATGQFLKKIPQIHENIQASVQKVTLILSTASEQLDKIVDYYAEIHQIYNQVNNKCPQYKIIDFNDLLINTNNLFHVISNNIASNVKILNENLKQKFKISLNYDKSMSKLHKNLIQTQKQYLYSKSSLNKRKQKLYPDVAKWQVNDKILQNRRLSKEQAFDLMLPKQTQQQFSQKNWLSYLYCNYRQQFQTYITFQVKRYADIYCTYCSDLLLNNKNFVQQLTKYIDQSKKIIQKYSS